MTFDVFAGLSTATWAFGLIILILWIALPFAVFGIKARIDKGIKELKVLNKRLVQLHTLLITQKRVSTPPRTKIPHQQETSE